MTGSTRGIGYAVAQEFLREGARVLVNGVNTAWLHEAVRTLHALGEVHGVVADLSTDKGIRDLFEAVDNRLGGIDILVNNAAIHEVSSVSDAPWEVLQRTINTNLRSVAMYSKMAFERMKHQGGGVILNASSSAAYVPALPYGVYSSIKAAILALTQVQAAEFARFNIRVNSYVSGTIETDMTKDVLGIGRR